ncbi:hypothetical protein EMVG_00062 [Emiliania huxleyi virus PS401]|nr:hypothetical protein EMVG_00062 [Emiliania huxleyi virus PS401]
MSGTSKKSYALRVAKLKPGHSTTYRNARGVQYRLYKSKVTGKVKRTVLQRGGQFKLSDNMKKAARNWSRRVKKELKHRRASRQHGWYLDTFRGIAKRKRMSGGPQRWMMLGKSDHTLVPETSFFPHQRGALRRL